ncbi:MAG TPA: hypothetical protein VGO80_07420 [Solirubrobacteraceae bacterium]|jgi:hypothetical protein|nr:hypothetical protein [Solirubrobacteraceae bacterium]
MTAAERRALIAALLGPDGHELTCEDCFEQLDRYVELQLAGAYADRAVPGMRAHLAGCPACQEDHASLAQFVASHAACGSQPRAPRDPV